MYRSFKIFLNIFENFLSTYFTLFISLKFYNLYKLFFKFLFFRFFEIKRKKFRFLRLKKFLKILSFCILFFFYKDPAVLGYLLNFLLKKNKNHKKIFLTCSIILNFLLKYFPKISGILIRVAGRIHGSRRSKNRWFQYGLTPSINSYNKNVNYFNTNISTFIGILGIQIWIQ